MSNCLHSNLDNLVIHASSTLLMESQCVKVPTQLLVLPAWKYSVLIYQKVITHLKHAIFHDLLCFFLAICFLKDIE